MALYRCNLSECSKERHIRVGSAYQGGAPSYADGLFTEENIGYKTATVNSKSATYLWIEPMTSLDALPKGPGTSTRNIGDVIDISGWKYIGIYVMANASTNGYATITLS